MKIDKVASARFLKKVSTMVEDGNWAYMVIKFKKDCLYHYTEEHNNPDKEFKYQFTQRVNSDICSNLNYHRNNLIKHYNQNLTGVEIRWNPNVDYDFPKKGDPLPKYIDKLKREDLKFVGILEFNPAFTRTKLLYNEFSNDLEVGTHVHLFFQNKTHLTPLQIYCEFFLNNPKHRRWKDMIAQVSSPQICNIDFYQSDQLVNYHLKQLQGDFQLIIPNEHIGKNKRKAQNNSNIDNR